MRSNVNTYSLHLGKLGSVTFPERLQALVTPGKSERQVAASLGISHTQFARYVKGAQPTMKVLVQIADRLDLSLDELVGRSPDRKRKPLVVSVDGEFYVPVSEARAVQIGEAASPTDTAARQPSAEERAAWMAESSRPPSERRRADRRKRRPRTDEEPAG